MTDDPLLDQAQLREALRRLAERLRHRGVIGNVYLFGGGAMVLAFDARPATRDLDGRFGPNGPIQEEALAIAREMDLPGTWLNEQGVFYLPRTDEPDPTPVFDHPNLRVMRASDRHLLAMKAMAARRFADLEDLAFLTDRLGLKTVEEVEAVCREVFPDEPLGDRQREVLGDVLAGRVGTVRSEPPAKARSGRNTGGFFGRLFPRHRSRPEDPRRCGAWMRAARVRCGLPPGHAGHHRSRR